MRCIQCLRDRPEENFGFVQGSPWRKKVCRDCWDRVAREAEEERRRIKAECPSPLGCEAKRRLQRTLQARSTLDRFEAEIRQLLLMRYAGQNITLSVNGQRLLIERDDCCIFEYRPSTGHWKATQSGRRGRTWDTGAVLIAVAESLA